jgi:hypothetical protein
MPKSNSSPSTWFTLKTYDSTATHSRATYIPISHGQPECLADCIRLDWQSANLIGTRQCARSEAII